MKSRLPALAAALAVPLVVASCPSPAPPPANVPERGPVPGSGAGAPADAGVPEPGATEIDAAPAPALDGAGSPDAAEMPDTADWPFPADPATHVFHRRGCAACAGCTVAFRNPFQPLHEGYLPCPECRPTVEPPPEEASDLNACRRDSDCVVHTGDGCGCGPCGYAWPHVLNRRAHERLRAQYAIETCVREVCSPCPVDHIPGGGDWLPVDVECTDGHCALRYRW